MAATNIPILDDSGALVGSIRWDDATSRIIIDSTEGINLASNNNGSIENISSGSGSTIINGLLFPKEDGSNGQVLSTDGNGNLSFLSLPIGVTISLGDLVDTDFSAGLDDGWAITYDVSKSAWVAGNEFAQIPLKADKVIAAVTGNFAGLDANGNLTDSGSTTSTFATAAQGTKADSALQDLTNESIDDLSDVVTPAPAIDEVLMWGGSAWINSFVDYQDLTSVPVSFPADPHTHTTSQITDYPFSSPPVISDMTDVNTTGVILNDALIFNGSTWVPGDAGNVDSVFGRTGVVTAISGDYSSFYATIAQGALADTALQDLTAEPITDLLDVTISNVQDDQFLQYDQGSGQWSNVTIAAPGAPALGGITDVTLTNEQNDQVITYQNGTWVNQAQVGIVTSVHSRTGDVVSADGDYAIGQMSNVDITGISNGKILVWQTDKFVVEDQTGGGGGSSTFTGLVDTPASFLGQAGDILIVSQAENALEYATSQPLSDAPIDGGAYSG